MKFFILFILILKIFRFEGKFFKAVPERTKMNNMACTLSEKFEEVSGLERNYTEFYNSLSDSDEELEKSPKFSEFIEELKKDKVTSDEFLIIKMFYGDEIASRLYLELAKTVVETNQPASSEINEDEVFSRVKEVALMTNGIGAKSYAQYQAIQYLKEYKLRENKYRCDVSSQSENYNSEREIKLRTENGENYVGWRTIKFYKNPKSPKIHNSNKSISRFNSFPGIIEYVKNNLNHCNYQDNPSSIYVKELSEINLYEKCEVQIIGDHTNDSEKREVVKLTIDGSKLEVKFYVSEHILDYNCLGWAIGLMDWVNPYLYTSPPRTVQTKKELKLFLKQFKEAIIAIKKWNESLKDKQPINSSISKKSSILDKMKPGPSLLRNLVDNNIIIDGDDYLTGIKDDITQAQIANVCRDNLEGAVIFYGKEGHLTHAARYCSELNTWTSKMGHLFLATHSLHLLDDTATEKSVYGKPKFIYCPKGINYNAEGLMPGRSVF
jgi:hypothetical protein